MMVASKKSSLGISEEKGISLTCKDIPTPTLHRKYTGAYKKWKSEKASKGKIVVAAGGRKKNFNETLSLI